MTSDGPGHASASSNAFTVCASFAPSATCATNTFPYDRATAPRSFFWVDFPAAALRVDVCLRRLRRVEQRPDDVRAEDPLQLGEPPPGLVAQPVDREPHPEAELGVVLEERVAPGRTPAVAVDGPRRRRQVAAV